MKDYRFSIFNFQFSIFNFLLLLTLSLSACSEEESDLGIDLTDPTTLYQGVCDTLYADAAWTEPEDTLLTSNYSFGIIGNYTSPLFGKVSSSLYTQIALPSNANDISFNDMVIDSVILTFTPSQLFPDTGATYTFHFEVRQLAEPLLTDSLYYNYSTLPVDPATLFFDDDVTVGPNDSLVNLRLDPSFNAVLLRTATAEEFLAQTKGLRIRITNAADEGMLSIDFAAATTCLRAYYHNDDNNTVLAASYTFLMGAGTSHFTHFAHDYSGTIFGGHIDGATKLYLEPMGGQQVRMSFDNAVKAFHQAHPYATIHHAELVMPVADDSPALRPDQILLFTRNESGEFDYIDDLINVNAMTGYDGHCHDSVSVHYRMRCTQHMQGLLRQDGDPGTLLLLNSRRHTANSLVLNGITTANRPRIHIVYSE